MHGTWIKCSINKENICQELEPLGQVSSDIHKIELLVMGVTIHQTIDAS